MGETALLLIVAFDGPATSSRAERVLFCILLEVEGTGAVFDGIDNSCRISKMCEDTTL